MSVARRTIAAGRVHADQRWKRIGWREALQGCGGEADRSSYALPRAVDRSPTVAGRAAPEGARISTATTLV
jgi:hypothetical protein